MIVDFVISGRFIRIFLLWKLWNIPANKAKRGDFDCESSLSLFHNEDTKSNAKAKNVLKMGLNFHMHLFQVFCVLFTAVSVITCKTPCLFYGILLFSA